MITVKISDFEHGLREYSDVTLVRIKSKDYTLLIMEDHFPVLGKIEGNLDLVTGEDTISISSIRGFFMNRHNEFTLLIEDYISPKYIVEAESDE